MQTDPGKSQLKYYAPCDERAWQQVLRDIQYRRFPLCKHWVEANPHPASKGEEQDQGDSPCGVAYCPAPNLNPYKVCIVDPLEAFCDVTFKYGYLVVRTPEPGSPKRREAMMKYMKEVVAARRGGRATQTRAPGSIFRVNPRVAEAKIHARQTLLTAIKELGDIYKDSIPISIAEPTAL